MTSDQMLAQLRESLKQLKDFQARTHGPPVPGHVELSEAQWEDAVKVYANAALLTLMGLNDAGLLDVDESLVERLEHLQDG